MMDYCPFFLYKLFAIIRIYIKIHLKLKKLSYAVLYKWKVQKANMEYSLSDWCLAFFFYWLHCINYFLDLWANAENQYILLLREKPRAMHAPHVLFPKNRYASEKNLRNGMRRGCFLMRWDGCVCVCVCARVVLKGFQCFYFEFYVSPVFYYRCSAVDVGRFSGQWCILCWRFMGTHFFSLHK